MTVVFKNDSLHLMDNLRLDEIQVYGAPEGIHTVYLDHFKQFFDFQFDAVSIGQN